MATAMRAVKGRATIAPGTLLVLPVREGQGRRALRGVDTRLANALSRRMRDAEFRGRGDDLLVHHDARGTVALVGIGNGGADPATWRRLGARTRREADRQGLRQAVVSLGDDVSADAVRAIGEGFLLAGYRFDAYRAERKQKPVPRLTVASPKMPSPRDVQPVLDQSGVVAAQVCAARDLVNEPPSVATPSFIAAHAERLGKEIPGLEVEVWGPKRIAKEGLAGLEAVARGSREEPRFIRLHWKPSAAGRHVALVGKGITFDSGGLSLKPAKSMETMKYDMAGAAAVVSATAAAAALGLPVEVTTYVPCTENLPSGTAQKPGDVIRYANGKSVEVLNTDAEGRLILADALVMASRAKPDAVVDLATLTGAARVALGVLYAGVLGNDQALVDALLAASRRTGEPLWQLPLVRDYRDDLRSGVADLKNVSGAGEGGTITAALFLEEFVDGVPWAHLDIAGPAFTEKDLPHAPRGGTGYGVRLLVEYLRGQAAS